MTNPVSTGEGARPAESALARLRRSLRDSRALIFVELAAVVAVFIADKVFHVIWLSETLYLFALGVISLTARRVKWREIGFSFPRHWPWLVLIGVAAGALIEAQELLFTQPLLIQLTGQAPDLSDFRGLQGNMKAIWLGVPFVWVLAAFGEEWVWRGYLMNRAADLFGRRGWGWLAAVIVANTGFGLAHFYQGPIGMIEAGEDGVLFALVYFATGRNLIAAIVAHGVQDSIDLALVFTGHYPIPI